MGFNRCGLGLDWIQNRIPGEGDLEGLGGMVGEWRLLHRWDYSGAQSSREGIQPWVWVSIYCMCLVSLRIQEAEPKVYCIGSPLFVKGFCVYMCWRWQLYYVEVGYGERFLRRLFAIICRMCILPTTLVLVGDSNDTRVEYSPWVFSLPLLLIAERRMKSVEVTRVYYYVVVLGFHDPSVHSRCIYKPSLRFYPSSLLLSLYLPFWEHCPSLLFAVGLDCSWMYHSMEG